MMDANDYQKAAQRTVDHDCDNNIQNFMLGIIGESGEFADIIKKRRFQDMIISDLKLKDELGDLLWYVSNFASEHGWSLEELFGDVSSDFYHEVLALFVDTQDDPIYHCILRIAERVGHLSHLMFSFTVHKRGNEYIQAVKSLLYWICAMAVALQTSIGKIMDMNIAKLEKRYPSGFVAGGGIR